MLSDRGVWCSFSWTKERGLGAGVLLFCDVFLWRKKREGGWGGMDVYGTLKLSATTLFFRGFAYHSC